MGTDLFGVDIAGIIADAMSGGLPSVTITQPGTQARAPGNLTGGTAAAPVVYEGASGFWEDFTGTPPPGLQLQAGDRKAVLIGDTIPDGGLPLRGAGITIGGVTMWVVQTVRADPAGAVYVYQCRDRGAA